MRNRSNTSSSDSSKLKFLLFGEHCTFPFPYSKDATAAGCTIDAFSFQSDDEPLRVVPFFELQAPLEKKRRRLIASGGGRSFIRHGADNCAHSSSRTESYFSQTPSESRSLRLLQWSCLFPREICFDETSMDSLPGDLILFDPTEPLIYGQLDGHQDPILVQSAHLFQVLLEQHRYNCINRDEDELEVVIHDDDETLDCMVALLRDCPSIAQVQYPLPCEYWMDKNACQHCFPLVHFCVYGCMTGLSACYNAFPEAIGCAVHGWLPLHFAARHGPYATVQFLLDKFPNAVRRTHPRTHKTPLHVACQRSNPCAKSSIIRRIMQQFPTALQLADRQGWVPVHHLCADKASDVYLLQTLIEASPTTIRATTRHLELPLHILCRDGSCRFDSVHYLLSSVHADPRQAQATDLDQNTIFHCMASNVNANVDALECIMAVVKRKACSDTLLESTNMGGETAMDVFLRLHHGESFSTNNCDILRLLATTLDPET